MKARWFAPFTCAALAVACADNPPPPAAQPPPVAPPPMTATAAPPVAPPAAPPATVVAIAKGAALLDGLGSLHRPVTAKPEAQAYFDQGLRLAYGFNHDEATRSFAKGAELDPSCAMCFWGAALTMGPNYNVPMLPDRAKAAWDALEAAVAIANAGKVTPVEHALVVALSKRYKGPEPLDPPAMQPFNVAYANAMREVAKAFPDDDDVQVLFAESMMDVAPWKLWTRDGQPAPGTDEIVSALERVIARAPSHPGANHYYIHAIEASSHPEKALPSAERLAALMPGAGHVVHMPAHIFQRVGRYADAAQTNENAVVADEAYMKKLTPPGYYPMYLGHNYGFLAFAASMQGRSAKTIEAARATAKAMPPQMLDMMPGMDFFVSAPVLAMVRFGKWDEILKEPKPDAKYMTLTAFWLHAHGMALATTGKVKEARADRDELTKLVAKAPADLTAGNNPAKDVFAVAAKVLDARIATVTREKKAFELWAEAAALTDKLVYDEPDTWFYPVRHLQGAALLAAGKAKDAEAVYRADLAVHPKNGWALFGLWKSLEAQHKAKDAEAAKAEFDEAWKAADVKITASAF